MHDGIPVIEGALAWVGCRLERLIPGGDHTIGIGAVEAAEAGSRRAAAVVPRGLPRVTAIHIALGVALIAVNFAAGAVGRLVAGGGGDRRRGFWPLLRTGQALVMIEAVDGRSC